jgi:hypothetical protein
LGGKTDGGMVTLKRLVLNFLALNLNESEKKRRTVHHFVLVLCFFYVFLALFAFFDAGLFSFDFFIVCLRWKVEELLQYLKQISPVLNYILWQTKASIFKYLSYLFINILEINDKGFLL